MTPENIKALCERVKRLADAATPGPWHYDSYAKVFIAHHSDPDDDIEICRSSLPENNSDLAFIASARTDLPALVSIIEEQARRIRELEGLLNEPDILGDMLLVGCFGEADWIERRDALLNPAQETADER